MAHTFLLATFKGEAGDWLEGFDVFRVTLSLEQIVTYVDMMHEITALQHRHPTWSLYQFRIWDYPGEWCAGDHDADPIEDAEGNEVSPPLLKQDEDLSRTELDIAHVDHDGIHWTAYPKHCDTQVSTGTLNREKLEQIIHTAALEAAKETP